MDLAIGLDRGFRDELTHGPHAPPMLPPCLILCPLHASPYAPLPEPPRRVDPGARYRPMRCTWVGVGVRDRVILGLGLEQFFER